MPNDPTFAGDTKVGSSLLSKLENPLQRWLARKVPSCLQTYHLTLLTLLWSALMILFGYLASENRYWLWASSCAIVLQYLTDLVDGEVGRQRGTGLIKWGFYMDHFLDFIFLCSMLIGYFFLLPTNFVYLHFFLLSVLGAFMVNSFLSFAALNRFRIAYCGIGPTEVRIGFIVANTLLALFGVTHLRWALPWLLGASTIGLCITVYRTQRELWGEDMRRKAGQGNTQ
jgi:phosphatidylglycerophosphate synthase